MAVNRIVLQGSLEECARVVDDSRIEVVLRHDSEIDPFFFVLEAPFGLDPLAVRLLTLGPRDEVLVVGELQEGGDPSASIRIRALTLKSRKATESPFEQHATPFEKCSAPFYKFTPPFYEEFGEYFEEGAPEDGDLPF